MMISLQVSEKQANGHGAINLLISNGDFEVLRSIANYAIPKLLGFDLAFPIQFDEKQEDPSTPPSPFWK